MEKTLLQIIPGKQARKCISNKLYVQWINNWPLTKWRWGAWSIQELPLLVARRLLSWHVNPGNPAMHPTQKGVEQAAVTLIKKKNWKEKEGQGREAAPEKSLHTMLMFKKSSDLIQKLLWWPVVQEHMESWHVHMSKCHWPQKQDLPLLLVTALYFQLQLYSPSQTEMIQTFVKTKINSLPVVYVNFLVQSIFSKAVTLVGMWLIPLYFNIKLKFWRMLTAWLLFSILTGFIVFKSTRKPVSPSTPR